jgi:hypothetical protein
MQLFKVISSSCYFTSTSDWSLSAEIEARGIAYGAMLIHSSLSLSWWKLLEIGRIISIPWSVLNKYYVYSSCLISSILRSKLVHLCKDTYWRMQGIQWAVQGFQSRSSGMHLEPYTRIEESGCRTAHTSVKEGREQWLTPDWCTMSSTEYRRSSL